MATTEVGRTNDGAPINPKKRMFKGGKFHNGRPNGRAKKRRHQDPGQKKTVEGTNEEVLAYDIRDLVASQDQLVQYSPVHPELFTEIDLTINALSSTGDGLAIDPTSPGHAYIVPFSLPGDTVRAKTVRHVSGNTTSPSYTFTDFLSVITPSPERDDSLVRCPYFATCSGCQFQMLPYERQLAHKKTIVEKAYRNFSKLSAELVPEVGMTIGSPKEYGYRTKLTPHFDGPPGGRQARKRGETVLWEKTPPIGFMRKGTRRTLDIEDCPISTDAVRRGLKQERDRVGRELHKYKKGATLILRETTKRVPKNTETTSSAEVPPDAVVEAGEDHIDYKTCVTDPNGTSIEYVSNYAFSNPASAFFQNNNSILEVFTDYIRKHILSPPSSGDVDATASPTITHLIDAYSGSGLFTITLSDLFSSSFGVDVAASSISSALKNLDLNNLSSVKDGGQRNIDFISADATALFASITSPSSETAVILDPPRKGCDESFLRQLMSYGAERVVYVSCNVHTQARDVEVLVGSGEYEVESLRGFDFFPQTGHVEGVAILQKTHRQNEEADEHEQVGVATTSEMAEAKNPDVEKEEVTAKS